MKGGKVGAITVLRLTCRFCSYSVPRWRRGQAGKLLDGMQSLDYHVAKHHEAELRKIRAWAAKQAGGSS